MSLAPRGRPGEDLQVQIVRELTLGDLELASTERNDTSIAQPRARLGQRHHALARCLADGMSQIEAATVTGYNPQTVHILRNDPTFKELVEFYRGRKDAEYAEFHEQAAGLAVDAVVELRTRLEDTPEDISIGQLIEMGKFTADRTGHGPQSSTINQHNHTINFAERLKAAREREAKVREAGVVIDVLPLEIEDKS